MFPLNVEKDYEKLWRREITSFVQDVKKKILKELSKNIVQHNDSTRGDVVVRYDTNILQFLHKLGLSAGEKINKDVLLKKIKTQFNTLSQFSKKIILKKANENLKSLKVNKAVAGIDLFGTSDNLTKDIINSIAQENVDLIKLTKVKHVEGVKKIIIDGMLNGKSQTEIAHSIAKLGATDLDRAAFWARDQAGSFYGKVAKVQQQGAGFNGYIWRGLRDNKLRDSHSEMLDKYFDWDSPPLVGDRHLHPGEDYRCRCHAEPAMSPEDADQQTDPWGFPLPEGKTVGTGKPEKPEQNNKRTGIGKDLEEKLPVDVQFDMKNKLDKAPEPVKRLWYKHADDLRIVEGNSQGAFFSPFREGIYVNIAEDILGAKDSKPHRGMFHEFGHNLDFLAGGKNRYRFLSSQFVSKRFDGLSFSDMLHKEAKEYEGQIKKRLQEKAARKGLSRRSVKIDYVRSVISRELQVIKAKNRRAASDIWHGVSKEQVNGGYGHGRQNPKDPSYWRNKTALPAEAFAHMTETSFHNQKALENIKKYFPKSYELYLEMIESIGDIK